MAPLTPAVMSMVTLLTVQVMLLTQLHLRAFPMSHSLAQTTLLSKPFSLLCAKGDPMLASPPLALKVATMATLLLSLNSLTRACRFSSAGLLPSTPKVLAKRPRSLKVSALPSLRSAMKLAQSQRS